MKKLNAVEECLLIMIFFHLGRGAKEANLYSEIAEGISSYGVTRHRHGIYSHKLIITIE